MTILDDVIRNLENEKQKYRRNIRQNTWDINQLADKQRELKRTIRALDDAIYILRKKKEANK